MLLSITSTTEPATDLGYLLHKNPARLHTLDLSFGQAQVFYSEATPERCTAVLLLEVDPVRLVRGGDGREGGAFDQYVNDRPYAASSLLSTAIVECFSTAMNGRSKDRQELADTPMPFVAEIPVLPAPGGADFVRALFEPLGYEVEAEPLSLGELPTEWGSAPYVRLRLSGTVLLRDLLSHLYVLIPVLDLKKHYYVNQDEVDKLIAKGGTWLANHPRREDITRRYLLRDRNLTAEALRRLEELEDRPNEPEVEAEEGVEAAPTPRKQSLHEVRLEAVVEVLAATGANSVLDLGCGEGRLLKLLLKNSRFQRILGIDVSWRALEIAKRRLRLNTMPERMAARIELAQGSLVYRDQRLAGFDAAALVEVIEHLDPFRLNSLERVVFEFARPRHVVVTTPNQEYNALYPTMAEGAMRHSDHRFEWTRAQFDQWANGVAARNGYTVELRPLGPEDETHGAPSQMAIFSLA